MPLHNVIPLGTFQYAREVYSSGTFLYDLTHEISKDKTMVPVEHTRIIEIDKTSQKLLKGYVRELDKRLICRRLRSDVPEIEIETTKDVEGDMLSFDKVPDLKELNRHSDLELHVHDETKDLDFPDINELNINEPVALESNKSKSFEINIADDLKGMQLRDEVGLNKVNCVNIEIDKSLLDEIIIDDVINVGSSDILELEKESTQQLQNREDREIDLDGLVMGISIVEDAELNIIAADKNIERCSSESSIDVDGDGVHLERIDNKDLHIIGEKYVDEVTILGVEKDESKRPLVKNTDRELDKSTGNKLVYSTSIKPINKNEDERSFEVDVIRPMEKAADSNSMDALGIIDVHKADNENYLEKTAIRDMHISDNTNYLDYERNVDLYKDDPHYLDRLVMWDVFKQREHDMEDVSIVPVYREFEKPILNLSVEDIFKDPSYSLQDVSIKPIHIPHENKYLGVTNRWWWLNPTLPKDPLIVPNRDFAGMKDLLNNDHYEYLRYSNHPIDWGKNWGKSQTIPPDRISIEIMNDLVNIIIMIWHKNVQGWMNVSGKEGIQLLMELLYDWYSMNTSSPDKHYYRAYRWVRWEAEKVYFLETTSGLQAIGILVRNLREYLKMHHFNRVPIWRNPKAMDEERNFNRTAQNGDLMVPLDKIKGSRHYYIETQDMTKGNPLLQT